MLAKRFGTFRSFRGALSTFNFSSSQVEREGMRRWNVMWDVCNLYCESFDIFRSFDATRRLVVILHSLDARWHTRKDNEMFNGRIWSISGLIRKLPMGSYHE